MQRITSALSLPLYDVAATRAIERAAAASLPPHALMQRAGRAMARLTLALAPHARHVWIACGPGNNGGDGFEAALCLHQGRKKVTVTWTGASTSGQHQGLPADAQLSLDRARAAGVVFADTPPDDFDFCIDALLGIGGRLLPPGAAPSLLDQWLALLRSGQAPVLAVDVPTGLNADAGYHAGGNGSAPVASPIAIKSIAAHAHPAATRARFCLSLLTLKPGLFTAAGRDLSGEVWLDNLGVSIAEDTRSCAYLSGGDTAAGPAKASSLHASHKGSFGDVAVVGGESHPDASMAGAALLAARAALHAGAGRVMVALLGEPSINLDLQQPELMFRSPDALDCSQQVIVCGCGGGQAVKAVLPKILSTAVKAVFDADALNAVAADTQLQALLAARAGRGYRTVLTPHPLEAARLLGSTAAQVQADRLAAANALAQRFSCVVVLKGSGTVIAAPQQLPVINPTGNALLATAGTGDVLAGMVGAHLARGDTAWQAACSAVFLHGQLADEWGLQHPGKPLTASGLARQARHA